MKSQLHVSLLTIVQKRSLPALPSLPRRHTSFLLFITTNLLCQRENRHYFEMEENHHSAFHRLICLPGLVSVSLDRHVGTSLGPGIHSSMPEIGSLAFDNSSPCVNPTAAGVAGSRKGSPGFSEGVPAAPRASVALGASHRRSHPKVPPMCVCRFWYWALPH